MSTVTDVSAGVLKKFKRGIHVPHRKYTEAMPIEHYRPSNDILLPMAQHIGAACSPVVEAKQEVTLGQKVADTEAFVSAPIHSSINGVAGAGTICLIAGGRRVPALPIKLPKEGDAVPESFMAEFLDRDWSGFDPTSYDVDTICNGIREAGIVGQGGATFPTFIKLKKNPERPVDTILINGAECEPYLTADHRLILECPEPIIVGLRLAMQAAGAKSGLVCIESNKPDAIEVMRKLVKDLPGIEVAVCASTYPMGGERQLISAVLDREVPSAPKGLPLDVGVVVINVATAHAIARAIVRGKPFTHRIVTITGKGVVKPGNFLVPLGTMLIDLVNDACGGVTDKAVKVLAGGPMMGPTLPHMNVPIVKGTGGFTIMLEEETSRAPEGPCIRCGRCIDNCPLFLSPTKIAQAVKHRDLETAAQYDMNACCECGCCSYVCPANIQLPQYIRSGKNLWRIQQAQKK